MRRECPYCGSTNVEHHHDHDGQVRDAVDDGTPIYQCQGCLGLFPDE